MLVEGYSNSIAVRSTGRMSAKQMAPIIRMLESSVAISRYEHRLKMKSGTLKFTIVNMMTVLIWMEIKHLTLDALEQSFTGKGNQVILRNLGMPKGEDGRYQRPSKSWISTFKNHYYPKFSKQLDAEMAESIMNSRKGDMVFTCDSTPLEASRYSDWADYNPHYRIKMAKAHIVMVDGIPLFFRFSNGNGGDNPALIELLDRFDGTRKRGCFLTDGSYDSWETFSKVFRQTGLVMATNTGKTGVVHEDAEYDNVIRRYNRLNKERGFIPSSRAKPEFILRFLESHGERELAGWALRNLDMHRPGKIRRELARKRHICETVHHAMKRWVDFDVRGLHKRHVSKNLFLKMFACQLLCIVFTPYDC